MAEGDWPGGFTDPGPRWPPQGLRGPVSWGTCRSSAGKLRHACSQKCIRTFTALLSSKSKVGDNLKRLLTKEGVN